MERSGKDLVQHGFGRMSEDFAANLLPYTYERERTDLVAEPQLQDWNLIAQLQTPETRLINQIPAPNKYEAFANSTNVVCQAPNDKIAIPTQIPIGNTNLSDCTQYPIRSETARKFAIVKDSVVKISGQRVTDGVTLNPSATGFFVTPDGMLATDLHLLRGLKNITITTQDGKKYRASVVAVDRRTDLAILQIDNPGDQLFKSLPLGSSKALKKGDDVSAWGFPLGTDRLYVSPSSPSNGFRERTTLQKALDKPGSASKGKLLSGERANREVLDSDILVNLGNSGGPLIDQDAQVVGIIDLSDIREVAVATPVEPIKELLAFAREQSNKTDRKIYFDEEDTSEGNSPARAKERANLRAERLELEINVRSVKKDFDYYVPHLPSKRETFVITPKKPPVNLSVGP